jgi:hypothetical protein
MKTDRQTDMILCVYFTQIANVIGYNTVVEAMLRKEP